MIDQICEVFGCLPSQAQRELDEDPERLALLILDQRAYKAAHSALHNAQNIVRDLQAWKGSPTMTLVETHTYELNDARLAALDADHG